MNWRAYYVLSIVVAALAATLASIVLSAPWPVAAPAILAGVALLPLGERR